MGSNAADSGVPDPVESKLDTMPVGWRCACLLSILRMTQQLYFLPLGTRISSTLAISDYRMRCVISPLRTVSTLTYTVPVTRNSDEHFDLSFKGVKLEIMVRSLVKSLRKELPDLPALLPISKMSIDRLVDFLRQSMGDTFDVDRFLRHLTISCNPPELLS